jgi:hypothetical protein
MTPCTNREWVSTTCGSVIVRPWPEADTVAARVGNRTGHTGVYTDGFRRGSHSVSIPISYCFTPTPRRPSCGSPPTAWISPSVIPSPPAPRPYVVAVQPGELRQALLGQPPVQALRSRPLPLLTDFLREVLSGVAPLSTPFMVPSKYARNIALVPWRFPINSSTLHWPLLPWMLKAAG